MRLLGHQLQVEMKMHKDAEGPHIGIRNSTIRRGRCAVQERWMALGVS